MSAKLIVSVKCWFRLVYSILAKYDTCIMWCYDVTCVYLLEITETVCGLYCLFVSSIQVTGVTWIEKICKAQPSSHNWKKMGNINLLFPALVFIKFDSLHPSLALCLLMKEVKAIPLLSLFAEEKLEHIPSICTAGHFASSIPITFYDFFPAGMLLKADRHMGYTRYKRWSH